MRSRSVDTPEMSSQVEGDLMEKAIEATNHLYHIRDTYFPANPDDKLSKLRTQSDIALKLLDSIPHDARKLPPQRATFEYLKGKILDVFADYRKDAEDHLSKAVKLNPSLADAWLCLGNCIWKKGDLPSAKNCFTLALQKGANKEILCQLSMLERKMAQGSENQAEMVEDSIKHAKEAITLDVKDGNSWYNLGNACLTSFFVTGSWDHSKLLQSLKAYQNAEKDERIQSNPDLYFNSATVNVLFQKLHFDALFEGEKMHLSGGLLSSKELYELKVERILKLLVNKYLENYERALSGFEAAALRDPCLNAYEEVQKIVNLLDKLENFLKLHTKSKKLANLASSIASVGVTSYKSTTVDFLVEGLNKAVAVVGKVMFFIRHDSVAPLYYLICDANQSCVVLSVYGMHKDAIREGDQLTLLDPYYRFHDFIWKDKRYQFKSIRVDFLEQILVNGKPLPPSQAVRTSIHAQHKP